METADIVHGEASHSRLRDILENHLRMDHVDVGIRATQVKPWMPFLRAMVSHIPEAVALLDKSLVHSWHH